MSYVQLSQELSEVRGLIQKLLNNSKNINGFDINEGDIEPLVLAVYNTNKNKTEKVPYSNLLNQKHFKGFYGSQTELTNSIPNPNSNDFAFISNEGEINFVLFNNNSWTNIFDYVNTHISDTETHVTSQEKTNWNNKVDKETNKGLSTNDYTTEEKQKLRDLANTVLNDTLTSTSVTEGLTANQGRVLKGLIDAINQLLTSDDTSLDELQEIVAYIKQNRSTLNALSISNIAGLQNTLSKLETAIATAETTAKNHAKALDDAIEIGTRNKLKLSQLNSYFRLRGNSKVIGNGFEKIFKCDNPNYWAIIPIANTTPLIPKNKKFTLSFEYRRNLENGLGFELTGTKATPTVIHGLKKLPENNTDNWKVFTETLTANYTDAYPFGGLSLWGVGEVRKITIVEGTKFTGLFPAPEDIQAEIDNKSKLIIGDNNAIPKFELSGENKQLNFGGQFSFDTVNKKINLKEGIGYKKHSGFNLITTAHDLYWQPNSLTQTGALTIKLPTKNIASMVTLRLNVEHRTPDKYDSYSEIYLNLLCNNSTGKFTRTAYTVAFDPITVRFGSINGHQVIYLGELNTSYAWGKFVYADKMLVSHQDTELSNWQYGWGFSIVQSFENLH